jgi:hypothetical protein
MIEASATGRAGTPDEVGTVGALVMGKDGGFITGSDFLMDGGVTAAYLRHPRRSARKANRAGAASEAVGDIGRFAPRLNAGPPGTTA